YSYNKKVDMLLIFDECKRNAREVAILSTADNTLMVLALVLSFVHKIVKQNHYHSYKMTKVHLLVTYESNPEILQNILWTDECKFSNNDIINHHNHHFWAKDNPHWFREHNFQQKVTMNVWCGLVYHGHLIGPYFYVQNLTAQLT
ncbi:hypothetical protein ALC53_00066, partial [Atta colombica]